MRKPSINLVGVAGLNFVLNNREFCCCNPWMIVMVKMKENYNLGLRRPVMGASLKPSDYQNLQHVWTWCLPNAAAALPMWAKKWTCRMYDGN